MLLKLAAGLALAAGLMLAPPQASAAPLAFTGTLSLEAFFPVSFPGQEPKWGPIEVSGSGIAGVAASPGGHLLSLALPAGAFGPATSIYDFGGFDIGSYFEMRLTLTSNHAGTFTPGSGGTMGLSGLLRICLIFDASCSYLYVPFPLSVTGSPARGFGVGGTQTATSGAIQNQTLQHSAWTFGQPAPVTLHGYGTTAHTVTVPGGYRHGPVSGTSSTAQASGSLQLVTVTKVQGDNALNLPSYAIAGTLTLHFVPEPSSFGLLAVAAVALVLAGRRR
jgi:hypothetical protein